jgi:exosortase A
MTGHDRRLLLALLTVVLACIGWQYRDTFAAIVQKWESDASFSHGVLILPVSLWLMWLKRRELAVTPAAPSWWGALVMIGCVAVWLVARGTGVLVLEQFAAVLMIPAAVLAVFGLRVTALLVFPLAFLLFAVPFGRGLVPVLMQVSADIGTWALKLTGIPVYRSHMHLSIPAGEFEVARACSGLNYFVTGLVLGVLYGYLTYAGWKKRLLCVLAFVVTPILMNGVRIYVIVLVSHLTDMRFGPGTEHIIFGRSFFIVIMFVMFWIGRRWRDSAAAFERPAAQGPGGQAMQQAPRAAASTVSVWAAVPAAALVALAGPIYFASFTADARSELADAGLIVALPAGSGGWTGPSTDPNAWRPQFSGAIAEQQAVYHAADGGRVYVYVGIYGLGTTAGAEMISFGNRVFPSESGSLARSTKLRLPMPDGDELVVRQLEGRTVGSEQLVWKWFVVGDRPLLSPYAVKAWEAAALVTRSAATERVIMIGTIADPGARKRLESFVMAHAACVHAGFSARTCVE